MEIIVGSAIIAFIVVIALGGLSGLKKTTVLDSAAESGISLLSEARAKTLSSEDQTVYGVHFETSQIVLFKGLSYSPTDPGNQTTVLHSEVEISNIALNGGGSEVIFQRLTGDTLQYGTVTFRLKVDSAQNRTITIGQSGDISL